MSEELLQMVPQQIGKHTYYRLGSTTLGQLMSSGIIPKKDYGTILRKKPDGLVVYHRPLVSHSLRAKPARVAAGRGLVANGS